MLEEVATLSVAEQRITVRVSWWLFLPSDVLHVTQCLSGVADGVVCSDQLAVVLQGKLPVLIQTLYLCLCPGSSNSVFRSIQNL